MALIGSVPKGYPEGVAVEDICGVLGVSALYRWFCWLGWFGVCFSALL